MSLEQVKTYFQAHGIEDRIVVFEQSTATVPEAAQAHQVDPDQIAKTLSFKLDDRAILIVVSGSSKIDNKKYKAQFSKKAKMLTPDEVITETGHAIGGVCPFGLKNKLSVYLDVSLQKHETVIPAAGDSCSSIPLSIPELEKYSGYHSWIDVCKPAA